MLAKNEILQGRYRIVRQLGHGGMGAVYEAVDERFGEPIALKEIVIGSANEKQKSLIIKAFEREAKSLAKARHEAIPYVRDYFTELDRQFLVMELVEGDDLETMLEKRGKPFPVDDVVFWIDQLLDALDYLHNLNPPIIHRDIKPQNLKLSFRRKIKLLDFGIAKSGDRTSTITNQTFVGATLDYSPIEQILRVIDAAFREFILLKHKEKAENILNQYTDARCDIYALGATFYHLLTNRLPESATRRTLAVWEGKEDPLPNPSQLNAEIPTQISACLLKAMEIERDNRFSSATEMQEALQTAMAEEKTRKKEKTLPLIEPEHLPTVEEEKNPEQDLTQAITERLIPEFEVKTEAENETTVLESTAPTEPLDKLPLETSDSLGFSITDSSLKQKHETLLSESISNSDLTGDSYFEEVLPDKKKTVHKPFSFMEREIAAGLKNHAKMFWLLPIAAFGVLTASSIGGIIWLSNWNSTDSTKPAANIEVSTPTTTPTIKPNISPSVQATPKTSISRKVDERPKTTVAPKSAPINTPVKTQRSKPKPKPTQDPNCVFTNSCR